MKFDSPLSNKHTNATKKEETNKRNKKQNWTDYREEMELGPPSPELKLRTCQNCEKASFTNIFWCFSYCTPLGQKSTWQNTPHNSKANPSRKRRKYGDEREGNTGTKEKEIRRRKRRKYGDTMKENKAARPPWRFVHGDHNGPFQYPPTVAANTANHSNCLHNNSSGRWK